MYKRRRKGPIVVQGMKVLYKWKQAGTHSHLINRNMRIQERRLTENINLPLKKNPDYHHKKTRLMGEIENLRKSL